MNIMRQQEVVEAFHYDINNQSDTETDIQVEINPFDMSKEEEFPKENSLVGLRVIYQIVFEEFVLTGAIRQLVTVVDKNIQAAEDLNKEEIDELVRPLFAMIERLTYEVTEIALDQPGVQLNFNQE
ncbi:DUF1149 family protein [Vagococcus humatus]|uniref:DUF1149 domain-containing protein n=1 Tax=Vagococcus humatus TaxID=1889241 RepID=A0A3S0AXM6_9ENTE|nr:DUF1149 family protein [Vagococcus humatus]RST89531.1 DUF1149 domain-containing protein [Vagococcus humatus]